MRVRCGACRTQFEVAGAGRFACPVCGSVNVVRNAAGADPVEETPPPPPPPTSMGGYPTAPGAAPGGAPPRQQPPPKPEEPMPKVECPECGFSFIVGIVDTVTCPMCSAEVDTGIETDEDE